MQMTQMTSHSVIASGTHHEHDKIKNQYIQMTKNIRKFNGSNLTYKHRSVANGNIFQVFKDGNLVKDISFLSDRFGIELLVLNFKG